MDNSNSNRPEGWGKRGPAPKQLKPKEILGIEIGRGDTRNIVPPEQVYELAALGCHNREIANFFGVKEDAIARNFAREIQKGKEELKITLRRAMLKNATHNMSAAVQIFLSKNILGMSDSPLSSESNAPLPWNESDDSEVEIEEYLDDSDTHEPDNTEASSQD